MAGWREILQEYKKEEEKIIGVLQGARDKVDPRKRMEWLDFLEQAGKCCVKTNRIALTVGMLLIKNNGDDRVQEIISPIPTKEQEAILAIFNHFKPLSSAVQARH